MVRASLAEGERALDRAEHVTLLSTAVRGNLSAGGEGGNGRLLLLPAGPRGGLAEVALYGVTDGWPLDVAKHVDEIEVRSDHGLKDATSGELFHKAAPVGESFGGSGEPDAPLVHTQKRGAQLGPVGVHDAFGVAGVLNE